MKWVYTRADTSIVRNLVKEENIAIAEAVENTADRFSGLKMIADIECFKKFLFSEVTAYTEPSIGVRDPNLEDKTWWDELKKKPKFKSEYWSRYYDYLLKKPSWSITAVKNIDSSTDEIMNALTNPRKAQLVNEWGWCSVMSNLARRRIISA